MINPDDLMGGLGIELTSLNDMLGSLINMLANKDRNTDGWVPPVDENGNPIPVDPGAVEIDGTLKEIPRVLQRIRATLSPLSLSSSTP